MKISPLLSRKIQDILKDVDGMQGGMALTAIGTALMMVADQQGLSILNVVSGLSDCREMVADMKTEYAALGMNKLRGTN